MANRDPSRVYADASNKKAGPRPAFHLLKSKRAGLHHYRRDLLQGLNSLIGYLPNLRGEVTLWKWRYELLPLKNEEETLSLLFVAETTDLSNLVYL